MSNPRKPAIVRKLEGNRGHRPIPREVIALGRPAPPSHLTASQLERWADIVTSLPDELLTAADTSTIERMAVAWATFREATAAIQDRTLTRGRDGNIVRNPLIFVRATAAAEMHACGLLLGLSPLARTRLLAPDQEEPDVLTRLLGSNGVERKPN